GCAASRASRTGTSSTRASRGANRSERGSVPEGDLDLHPVLREHDLAAELLARLAAEVARVAREARAEVREREDAHASHARDLRRLAGRRVCGLHRARRVLVAERRLVYEEVGAHRRVDRRLARPRVPGDDDRAPRARRADEFAVPDHAPIVDRDVLALVDAPPERPLGDAERTRVVGVEPPATLVLHEREAERRAVAVVDAERAEVVILALHLGARL